MELSLLDLAPIPEGGSATEAFERTVERARHAEDLGYARIWVAEHHDFPDAVASTSPESLIPYVAANTETIRVGSGTVLLNHYSPYKVAETFCVLDALAPGRIDLGVGRASGNPTRDRALQVDRSRRPQVGDHRAKIDEVARHLHDGFDADHPFSGLDLPRSRDSVPELWVHGSSESSAKVAGELGLRYCFAAFIRPQWAADAVETYRAHFEPSPIGAGPDEPTPMVAANVTCAPTDEEAARLRAVPEATRQRLHRSDLDGPPIRSVEAAIEELGGVPAPTTAPIQPGAWPRSISGSPETVRDLLETMADQVGARGIVIQNQFADLEDELRSHELLAEAFGLDGDGPGR
ncbi:MAG TPA: LLM class flavin-dependent oxidoreductase [Halobacteriales archaeon]|nr:LLM class flavin-dependent oxidoreductase [Halobacteriales archaeon]